MREEKSTSNGESGLKKLYVEQMKDVYNAETQMLKALPKLAKAATSDELRSAFEEHLEITREQAARLERVFQTMAVSPKGKKCAGMEGLLKEGNELLDEDFEEAVLDAGLIAAAQRVEHYEIAAYGTLVAYAEQLGEEAAAKAFQQSLEEEKEADEALTNIAESSVNSQAASLPS